MAANDIPINYFEGLGVPAHQLDADHVAQPDAIRAMRGTLNDNRGKMNLFRFSAPQQRRRLGPTNGIDQLEGSMICESFAKLRPDIAQEAGHPVQHWSGIIAMRLVLGEAADCASGLVVTAQGCELVLLQDMTHQVADNAQQINQLLQSPGLSESVKDQLRLRFGGVDEANQKIQRVALARRAVVERAWQAAKLAAQGQDLGALRLARRTELDRRLAQGMVPDLGWQTLTQPATPDRRGRGRGGATGSVSAGTGGTGSTAAGGSTGATGATGQTGTTAGTGKARGHTGKTGKTRKGAKGTGSGGPATGGTGGSGAGGVGATG